MLVDRGVSEEDTAEDGDPVESTDDEKKKKNFIEVHNTNGITTFACTICTSEFKTKWNCSAHIRAVHLKRSKICELCNKSFKKLSQHMSDVHSNKTFMCAICDIKFVSNRLLQRHVEIRHEQGNLEKITQRLRCEVCDLQMLEKKRRNHMELSHFLSPDYAAPCPLCQTHVKVLPFHLNKFHKDVNIKRDLHRCTRCRLYFKSAADLNLHSKNHEEYACQICKEEFSKFYDLAWHCLDWHGKVFNLGTKTRPRKNATYKNPSHFRLYDTMVKNSYSNIICKPVENNITLPLRVTDIHFDSNQAEHVDVEIVSGSEADEEKCEVIETIVTVTDALNTNPAKTDDVADTYVREEKATIYRLEGADEESIEDERAVAISGVDSKSLAGSYVELMPELPSPAVVWTEERGGHSEVDANKLQLEVNGHRDDDISEYTIQVDDDFELVEQDVYDDGEDGMQVEGSDAVAVVIEEEIVSVEDAVEEVATYATIGHNIIDTQYVPTSVNHRIQTFLPNKLQEKKVSHLFASKDEVPRDVRDLKLSGEDEEVMKLVAKEDGVHPRDLSRLQLNGPPTNRADRNNRNRYKFVDSRQAHVCPYCLNVLRTRYSLQKHISVKHLRHKPFSCTECNKTFSNNCDLKRHRSNSHAQQKMVKCEICNKEFRSGYLARHRQFAHSTRNTPSTCDKCYKVFKTREIMLQHSRLKHS